MCFQSDNPPLSKKTYMCFNDKRNFTQRIQISQKFPLSMKKVLLDKFIQRGKVLLLSGLLIICNLIPIHCRSLCSISVSFLPCLRHIAYVEFISTYFWLE